MDKSKMKKAETLDVVKLESPGDEVGGIFQSMNESVKYPESYAVKFIDEKDEKAKIVFVNNIGRDMLESLDIKKGKKFALVLKEKTKSERKDDKGEHYYYNTYEVYVE